MKFTKCNAENANFDFTYKINTIYNLLILRNTFLVMGFLQMK